MHPFPKPMPYTDAQIRVLNMALEITATDGPGAVSTPAIAKRLGVSQPAIFKHFATKDALLQAMVSLVMTRMFAGLEQILSTPSASPRDQLKRIVFHQVDMFETHPALPMILFSPEMQMNEGQIRDLILMGMERGHGILGQLIAQGQEAGEFRTELNPQSAAASLLALMQGTGFRWLISGKTYSLVTRAHEALSIFLSGLNRTQEQLS